MACAVAALTLCSGLASAQDATDFVGRTITGVTIEQEGRPVADPLILGLIETKVGAPLYVAEVRETIDHLDGLGRFDDVQVVTEASGEGVRLKYLLVPAHPVQQVLFRGTLGLPEPELRQAMVERHGALPPVARADDVAQTLRGLYRDHGYLQAMITPRAEVHHNPDHATLIFAIEAGPRAAVRQIRVEGLNAAEESMLRDRIGVATGSPYDLRQLRQALTQFENQLRTGGYYEARADSSTEYTADGGAIIDVAVERGPHVVVQYAGDSLPQSALDQLVPIRQEASVDEDLLENASLAIQDYLRARGYRDALATHARVEREGELAITFTIARGPRYVIESIGTRGNQAIGGDELRATVKLKPGEPFVQATLDGAAGAVREVYRTRGFTRARVEPTVSIVPAQGAEADRRVQAVLNVSEGARAVVGAMAIEGNTALAELEVRGLMTTAPGRPYSEVQLASDRDRVQTEYLNRGYESAVVEPHVAFAQGDTVANVRLAISEGPQVMVDHVIIIGNDRTSSATIERELLLRPGQPLGYAAMIDSQQRLSALGLFRRVRITGRRHGSEPRRDLIVEVEEAPPTALGYGGGLEGGWRLRPTAEGGQAEERFEIAPRGFFQIGRRNLFGKNRSIDLFTRVSLRSRDIILSSDGLRLEEEPDSRYGFNEYRVVATYREPRLFDTRADAQLVGILDQAIRSSFNFKTREVDAQTGLRLSPLYLVTGTYTYRATELFDEQFTEDEKPLIDRVFPQVRLSMLTGTIYRDTRNDVLDPDNGRFVALKNDFAARAYGSEVGFAKTYLQVLSFQRLPSRRRMILALAARVGAAHGFPRSVTREDTAGRPILGADGTPIVDVVEDLPASERFFAGGDTTVRGFSLDRLGDASTITPSGFPTGGNGMIVVNAEMRVGMFGGLTAVGFLDAGNVFLKAKDINVTNLRPAAGIGVRYRSPVGPIRVDWGFNLDRRQLVPARIDDGALIPAVQERRSVLHISLGQAF